MDPSPFSSTEKYEHTYYHNFWCFQTLEKHLVHLVKTVLWTSHIKMNISVFKHIERLVILTQGLGGREKNSTEDSLEKSISNSGF